MLNSCIFYVFKDTGMIENYCLNHDESGCFELRDLRLNIDEMMMEQRNRSGDTEVYELKRQDSRGIISLFCGVHGFAE